LPRIESSPKRVHLSGWNDHAGIAKNPALRLEPDEIIESIERGEGLPEKYYRAGIDQDPDELLQQRGIMHLHLGGKDSNTLVFLTVCRGCFGGGTVDIQRRHGATSGRQRQSHSAAQSASRAGDQSSGELCHRILLAFEARL
jgi:hypothetical protein